MSPTAAKAWDFHNSEWLRAAEVGKYHLLIRQLVYLQLPSAFFVPIS